ncbi:MAG: hypothetical protein WC956_00650 [bacterium]
MGFSRTARFMAAALSSALALGLIVDIVDEYATEAPSMATLSERPPITSPQLDGRLFVMDTNAATAATPSDNSAQQADQPTAPTTQPAPSAVN